MPNLTSNPNPIICYQRKGIESRICLQNDGVDDIGVLDGELERHAPGRGDGDAPNLTPRDAPKLIEVIDDDDCHKGRDA